MSRNLRYASARNRRHSVDENINTEIMFGLFFIAGFLFLAGTFISFIPSDSDTLRQLPQQNHDTTITH